FYRLAVFRVHLPPLRQRADDVLMLADHFLRMLAGRMGRNAGALSQEARDLLLAHAWPGNVRELQNAIERARILSDGGEISAGRVGIPPSPASAAGIPQIGVEATPPATRSLAEVEKASVLEALRRANGNKSRAAAALGLSRGALYTRLRRFGLTSRS